MLIDNILFLRERFPELRKYYAEHEKDLNTDIFELIDSKIGVKTIRYQDDKIERPLMVHSLYNPVQEAERIISANEDKINNQTHVFFYGAGMGYHIEKFVELYPNHTYSVYEPIPEVFYRLSETRELSKVFTKSAQNLYIDKHDEATLDYLNEFETNNQNIHLIVLPSYKNIIKDKHDQFYKNIKETILNRRSNLHTNTSFQKRWVENSLVNFKTVLDTPNMIKDIDRSQFEGKPALIVSAGPSLAEDIEHIRYIKENNLAYIFSVGSAINSLIEYDVLPDAVFTYDPKERNQNVFKKMYENNIDSIPMIFGSSVGFETLVKYKGPKVHFITSQDKTSLYFLEEQLNLERDLIIDAPSIAVMAFQILTKIGANPIIFTGQNLGYLNGRRFSQGIDYAHIPATVDKKTLEKSITTLDVYGNEIKTDVSFNNMRESIERYAKLYKDREFINTTKGGAAIKGIPFKPIEEVLKTFTNPLQINNWWENDKGYNQENLLDKYNVLRKHVKEFIDNVNMFENLLNSISISIKIRNESKLLKELSTFDHLYNKLNDNYFYKSFLSFYLRTEVIYIANEIKALNVERDTFKKGQKIISSFSTFLSNCKRETGELDILLKNNILDKIF